MTADNDLERAPASASAVQGEEMRMQLLLSYAKRFPRTSPRNWPLPGTRG